MDTFAGGTNRDDEHDHGSFPNLEEPSVLFTLLDRAVPLRVFETLATEAQDAMAAAICARQVDKARRAHQEVKELQRRRQVWKADRSEDRAQDRCRCGEAAPRTCYGSGLRLCS